MSGKKRGGGRTPYEAPDTLKTAQRLRALGLVSLGPIYGAAKADPYQSVFFDHTPLKNAQGQWNFQNTDIKFTVGTQDQLPLEGFEMSEREVPVGAEVTFERAIHRDIIDPDITRLRVTLGANALFAQNDQGDTHGTQVELEFQINGRHKQAVVINEKVSSRFHQSYLLDDLPPVPFTLTVKRLTPDSKSQRLQNATFWSSYTEIIDTKLSYPNMALIGITTDSRYNPNFPNVNLLLHGRLVKVPSNYDPDTRTYAAGIWRGDFKLAWTNNPAWVFYDLVTNPLAGLGKRLGDYGVDKFQLYQIAQYCDQLVPDGYGGFEPRMTANLWITQQRDAYSVLSDMASVFRALVVWNGTQLTAIQDRSADPVYTYTQANVINGKFHRQYVPLKSIYTAVEVEYINKRNLYQKAIEYVADDAMIQRYGYNVKKIVAFACTSRGQAHRYGKWVLETARLEQCTLTFSVGREGLQALPGDIIEVADNHYADFNFGGRVLAVNGNRLTLDRPLEAVEGESFLRLLTTMGDDKGVRNAKIVQIDAANPAIVELEQVPDGIGEMATWSLHTPLVSHQRFRVLTVAENDDGSFMITALQHVPHKAQIVDDGAVFDTVNDTRHQGLRAVSHAAIHADGQGIHLTFDPLHTVGQGIRYQVKLHRNGTFYQLFDDLTEPQLAFTGLPDGEYVAEVRAKNGHGQLSEPVSKSFSIQFAVSQLSAVSKVFGINLHWQNPIFANANAAIEIWTARENRFQTARKLVTLAYPTNHYSYDGLGVAETHYFWARMVDTHNNAAGEFTEAVVGITERSGEKLVNYLHGQLTKDSFSRQLINGLTQDIQTGVQAGTRELSGRLGQLHQQLLQEAQARVQALQQEAQARVQALQQEAQARTQALQQEARERGNAVRSLEQADRQHAQQLQQATAKAEQALAGVQSERTARASSEQATSSQLDTLSARLDDRTLSLADNLIEHALTFDTRGNLRPNANVGLGERQSERYQGSVVYKTTRNWQGFFLQKAPITTPLVLSFWAKPDGASCKFKTQAGNRTHQLSDGGVIRGDWKQYSITFPNGSSFYNSAGQGLLEFYEGRAYYALIKLEHGLEPTPVVATTLKDAIAQAQADIVAERTARVQGDEAATQAVNQLGSRTSQAEGAISEIQATKANKTEVANLARTALRSEWQADADVKVNTAKQQVILDAQAKADQAKQAAITAAAQTAQAKADAAKAQAIASASQDAQTKADAAKAQAIADAAQKDEALKRLAAQDAQAKADAVRAIAENAQALANQAKADILTERQTRTTAEQATAAQIEQLTATLNERTLFDNNLIEHALTFDTSGNLRPNANVGFGQKQSERYRGSVVYKTTRNWQGFFLQKLPVSTPLVLSFWAKPDGTSCKFKTQAGNRTHQLSDGGVIRGDWKQYSITFPNGTSFYNSHGQGFLEFYEGRAYYALLKLEHGLEPSDSTPSLHTLLRQVQADITHERTARTTHERAHAEQLQNVQSHLDSVRSSINLQSRAVTRLDGSVSAMHTISAQTLSNGKKAVAGITLGSSGGTQSEMILMADRLSVVKNAQDNTPKPMFTLEQNRLALRGDFIADGSITGNKIQANTELTAPVVRGGNIHASRLESTHIHAATIEGGVIRGTRFEGATGRFTGELEVTQLIGGGVIEQVAGELKYTGTRSIRPPRKDGESGWLSQIPENHAVWEATISFSPRPTPRYILIDDMPAFILQAGQSKEVKLERLGKNEGFSNDARPKPTKGIHFVVLAYALSEPRHITIR